MCVCRKCTFAHQSLIVKSQQNRIEIETRTGEQQAPEVPWRSTSINAVKEKIKAKPEEVLHPPEAASPSLNLLNVSVSAGTPPPPPRPDPPRPDPPRPDPPHEVRIDATSSRTTFASLILQSIEFSIEKRISRIKSRLI